MANTLKSPIFRPNLQRKNNNYDSNKQFKQLPTRLSTYYAFRIDQEQVLVMAGLHSSQDVLALGTL